MWANFGVASVATSSEHPDDYFSAPRWSHHWTTDDHPLGVLQEQLYDLHDEMIRRQWHFDMLFEPVLADARVEGSELVTEHARYRAIVLPSAEYLPAQCIERVREFAEAGGIVIISGQRPETEVETGEDRSGVIETVLSEASAEHVPARGEAVCARLDAYLDRPLIISGEGSEDFVTSWRSFGDSQWIFVANMNDVAVDVRITCSLAPPITVYDPHTTECFRPEISGNGRLDWHFEPAQAFVILNGDAGSPPSGENQTVGALRWLQAQEAEVLDGPWQFNAEPANMLRMDCQVRPDPENQGAERGWQHDRRAEDWMTPDNNLLPEPIEPAEAPWYWMRSKVICESDAQVSRVVADNPDFLELYVNGHPAEQIKGQPLWTEENVHFAVGDLFVEGENWVHVRARTSKYNDPRIAAFERLRRALQPLVLLGEFAVRDDQNLAPWTGELAPNRPWEQQGLPYFAGTGIYSRSIHIPDGEHPLLRLPECSDAVEVLLNGEACGVRCWHPYVFDLSPCTQPGENHLEIHVHNTLGHIIPARYGHKIPDETPTSGMLAPPSLLLQ